jgi:hypothetical protein
MVMGPFGTNPVNIDGQGNHVEPAADVRQQDGPILDHTPRPGPLHWDWRCLTCSKPVAEHGNWWQRWRHRAWTRRQ